jgi:hypothetical protein
MGADWEGWPFGRDLYVAEVFSLVQRLPGVKHVLDVQLSTRPVIPDREGVSGGEEGSERSEEALQTEKGTMIRVSSNTLICSLEHDVAIAELEEADV